MPAPARLIALAGLSIALTAAPTASAQEQTVIDPHDQGQPALTIYNGGFGVVRHTFPIDFAPGENTIAFAGATAQLDADSVILRDPTGNRTLTIYEQSYRNDPISQAKLLQAFEGQTIQFLVTTGDEQSLVDGTIIRSGYVGRGASGGFRNDQPIIQTDEGVRFGLPGQPIFPALNDQALLRPTLFWQVAADRPGKVEAELAYISSGLGWSADYNLIIPADDENVTGSASQVDPVDILGWITFTNNTGADFEQASIKLLAGDVNRIQERMVPGARRREVAYELTTAAADTVTDRSFSDFHLYTIARPTTLFDGETKQVEFDRAEDVAATRIYMVDSTRIGQTGPNQPGTPASVVRTIENTEANQLGIALPGGDVRLYQEDIDGTLQFIGSDRIPHTPKGQTVRIETGKAFDITAKRILKERNENNRLKRVELTWEITVANAKEQPVTVNVLERHWGDWRILEHSHDFTEPDANNIEFVVEVPAEGEVTINYQVRYQN